MKTKSQLQKQRGWIQQLPEQNNAILVKETKNFRLPNGLTCYNTPLNLQGVFNMYNHLKALFNYKAVDYKISNFSITKDVNEFGTTMTISFTTTTYSNSKHIKNEIDNLYSALLATHRINVSQAKLDNYFKYGKTSNKPY